MDRVLLTSLGAEQEQNPIALVRFAPEDGREVI